VGLFQYIRQKMTAEEIENSSSHYGISEGHGYQVCRNCSYRIENTDTGYYGCAIHMQHVYETHTCNSFEVGNPKYRLK